MNKNKEIRFKRIHSMHPLLDSVISGSIGDPTSEKITQVLQSYERPNQFLIGAFLSEKLIAVIGFELNGLQAVIKHMSILESFRRHKIGKGLIHKLIKNFSLSYVSLETDDESVNFYKRIGRICEPFEGKYGTRYHCSMHLSA